MAQKPITYFVKRGDTLPVIGLDVLNSDGDPYDLTGAEAVFYMFADDVARTAKVDGEEATVTTPGTLGQLQYAFQANDTDTAGDYLAQFEVSQNGYTITFPTQGFMVIKIEEDLGDA